MVIRWSTKLGYARIALLGAMSAVAACSLIVDTNADPCKTDADCTQTGYTCGPARLCVAAAVVSNDAATPPESGAPDASPDAAPDTASACSDQTCCTTAQCIQDHAGDPFTCPRPGSPCVSVITPSCPRVIGNAADPNAVLIGFVTFLTGTNAVSGTNRTHVVELAVAEVNQAATGLPGENGASRPVAAIVCEDTDDASRTHLIDELRLPVIVSGGSSANTVAVTPKLVANDVFYMCGDCGSPALTTLEDHDLVWRSTTASTDYAAPMAAYFQQDVEGIVRAVDGLASSAPVKLLVLSSRAFLFSSTSDLFVGAVRYNGGKTPLANGASFLRLDYDDPLANPAVDLDQIVSQVISYAPHAIVVSGSDEVFDSILPKIETGWAAGPRPFYLSSNTTPQLYTWVATNSAVRSRYRSLGDVYGPDTQLVHDAYALRLSVRFPADDPGNSGNVYDGIWAAMYAIAAVDPSLPLTGTRVSQAIARLVAHGQTPIAIGPVDVNNGFSILRQGGSIDLSGATTNLDFDSHGDVHGDALIDCVIPAPNPLDAGTGYQNYDTKRIYNATTGQMSGTDDCPP